MLIRNILYAVLLGVGMAACLSQNDEAATETATASEATPGVAHETTTAPDPATLVIAKGRVGNIRIGMPIEQVRQEVPAGTVVQDTLLRQEGMESTAYLLRTSGQQQGLLIEQRCEPDCRVWRINILSNDFKTAKGIGLGSKYSEVKAAYPIGTVALAEGNLVAISEESGMSFVLEDTNLPQDSKNKGKYSPANIPANTLVKRILLY
ncbi:mechanosensitive ion channel protein MscS [Pontibacter sp. CAU 1760]